MVPRPWGRVFPALSGALVGTTVRPGQARPTFGPAGRPLAAGTCAVVYWSAELLPVTPAPVWRDPRLRHRDRPWTGTERMTPVRPGAAAWSADSRAWSYRLP